MNKAFVKEVEGNGGLCPRCGGLGIAVASETLNAFIRPERRQDLADTGFFCQFPRCEAIYFDDFERYLTAEALVRPVWPKDLEAPICGCFGFKADAIEDDVRSGTVAQVKAAVAQANSGKTHCPTMSATGRNCAGEIQKYYFKLRSQGGS